jgi:hypothetical protein
VLRRILLSLTVAAVMVAFSGPALAQTSPADTTTSPANACAAGTAILEQLPVASTGAGLAPAFAAPGTAAPTIYTDTVVPGRGIETSAGALVGDTTVGASFIGEVTGDLPGILVASSNYTPPFPGPGVTNNIVGGEWALCGAWGAVYGSFVGGSVQWSADASRPDGTLADVVADMSVLGGSVNGVGASPGGAGTFSGVLDHRPLDQGLPPTVSGTLQLQISATPTTSGTLPDSGGPSLVLPAATVLLLASSLLGPGIVRLLWQS